MEQPLIDAEEINRRLEALEELNEKPMLRDEIREYLNPVYDLERLVSRISFKSANPRDMVAFASSLEMIPYIKQVLKDFQAPILKEIYEDMDSLEDITDLIKHAIVDEPPLPRRMEALFVKALTKMWINSAVPHRWKKMAYRAGNKGT